MYKIILSDMDGTLLRHDRTLSPGVIEAIKAAGEAGIIFSVATGRPEVSVRRFFPALKLAAPAILYNGVMIKDFSAEKTVFRKQLSHKSVTDIISMGNDLGTSVCVWSGGRLYINKVTEETEMYKSYPGIEPLIIDSADQFAAEGVEKILWVDKPERSLRHFSALGSVPDVNYVMSEPVFIEFFHNEVSKAVSAKRVCDMYGISMDECVTIGDGMNDFEMVSSAGLGIAMANAVPEIKACAKLVTNATNDADGVAEVIYKIIEMNKHSV